MLNPECLLLIFTASNEKMSNKAALIISIIIINSAYSVQNEHFLCFFCSIIIAIKNAGKKTHTTKKANIQRPPPYFFPYNCSDNNLIFVHWFAFSI